MKLHGVLARRAPARLRYGFVAVALAFGSAAAQAPGDVRLALVIGNAAYPGPAALPNPVNDAKAMGDTLRGLGFEVVELRDGTKEQMQAAIEKVREGLKGRQGIAMMYYAGHGLQLDWRNYMVPVDARLASAADVPKQAVDLSAVIEAFKAASTRMNILVLDACRDNPFEQASSAKGLAQMDAPPGTILAYATAPGNVAADGSGANGLYTQFLLQELVKPQSKIEDVFKRTRFAVRRASQGRQIPWESTSLEEDFMFNAGQVVAAPRPDDRAREQAFSQQKADWEAIKADLSADKLYGFLQKHPSGSYAEFAQAQLEALQKAQVKTQPGPGGKEQLSFLDRYREGDRYTFVSRDGLTGVQTGRSVVEIRYRGPDEFEGVAIEGNQPGARAKSGGFVIQDGGGSYDPPWSVIPGGELQVGKRASGRSMVTRRNGEREWMDYETRIVAREKLQSETLGELDTYRVEMTMVTQSGLRAKQTFWFEPDWGYAVRMRAEFRRGGAPDIRLREMVARSRKG